MYQQSYGTTNQVQFQSEHEYYELLGYLAKNDGTTRITWEPNDSSGAWAPEGRILFYDAPPAALSAQLHHTAGTSTYSSRVNCNEFVENLLNNHSYTTNGQQDQAAIYATVPVAYQQDFNRGLTL